MDSQFEIIRAGSVTPSANLSRLFAELPGRKTVPGTDPATPSLSVPAPDTGRINELIAAGSLAFYLVLKDGEPVGMASVIPCRTAASDKLWIEDVCILSECRGLGLGKALMQYLLKDAEAYFGKGTFWLTSRPSRVAARALYTSLGFQEHETGVFRL